MTFKQTWKDLWETLAPPENRLVALVALFRTFGQTFRGSTYVASFGGIFTTATGLAEIDWVNLGLGALAVVLASTGASLDAYFDVLRNGIPAKYQDALDATAAG